MNYLAVQKLSFGQMNEENLGHYCHKGTKKTTEIAGFSEAPYPEIAYLCARKKFVFRELPL